MGPSNFLYLAPVQVESLELGRRFGVRLKDIGWGLTLGLFGGLFIGGFALLAWAYGMGADNLAANFYDGFWYINGYHVPGELAADRAYLAGTLHSIPENQWWNLSANLNAKGFTIGVGVTWLLALLRGAFTWFPLHPLGYVLATTYFGRGFWCIALLAWIIRSLAQRLGGAHAIRRGVVPFAVGMFLGGVVSIIILDAISLVMRAQGAIDIYNNVWP